MATAHVAAEDRAVFRRLSGVPALTADDFGLALIEVVNRLIDDPWVVLFQKSPDYERGLNAERINKLARAAGFASVVVSLSSDEDGRFAYFHNPNGRLKPVEWRTWSRYGLIAPNDEKLQRTIRYLVTWLQRRKEILDPADGGQAKTRKPRGRKKADYETVQKEAGLAADWKRARDGGTYKGHFARERGLTVAKLDALLDRVAKRKRTSE